MLGNDRGGLTQGLIEKFRPHAIGLSAQAAMGWLRSPSYAPSKLPDAKALSLARMGTLEVRQAKSKGEIKRAQRLRYNVFYKEGGAVADAKTLLSRRDKDAFDKLCSHLVVVDHDASATKPGKQPVVGTYRLLDHDVAVRHGGFYTANEFDLAPLLARHPGLKFLELGRSCVLPQYRNKRTVELLWRGIWSYVSRSNCDVMIGCASLDGTDPDELALQLSFLHHHARAPEAWSASALPKRKVEMNRMPKDAIDSKAALRQLPPLIKGYLRLGAYVGDGAVVDHQFGTTDVLIIMPVKMIGERYIAHFGGANEQAA